MESLVVFTAKEIFAKSRSLTENSGDMQEKRTFIYITNVLWHYTKNDLDIKISSKTTSIPDYLCLNLP